MERQTHQLDATNQIAGRLASQVALLLQGKNKASYQPHLDQGDNVVISNIAQMKFSGKKVEQKIYYRHSGYPGGIKQTKLSDRMKKPEELFRDMVRLMLPKNKLAANMIKRLTFESAKTKSNESNS